MHELDRNDEPMTVPGQRKFTDIREEQWARLAERRIFFGHQSVGYNIMDGVADIVAADPQMRLELRESRSAGAMRSAGFYHAAVGRNQFPDEKLRDFAAVAEGAFEGQEGIALVKLCYVDVSAGTDPQALFDAYRRAMADLATRRPWLTLVHVTMPLTTAHRSWRYWRSRMLGGSTDEDLNVIRNRYNDLLRATYGGKEPVFDLARLESTRPDGSRSFFLRGTDPVYTLAEQHTRDGGHLGVAARRVVAEQLLIVLAELPP